MKKKFNIRNRNYKNYIIPVILSILILTVISVFATNYINENGILSPNGNFSNLSFDNINSNLNGRGLYTITNYTISNSHINWTNLESYPVACPAGSAITQLNDSIICTSYSTVGNVTINETGIYDGSIKISSKQSSIVVCSSTSSSEGCDVKCTVNDCSSAYQTALNYVNSTNGVLFMREGTFNFTSEIDLTNINNVSIIGSGIGSTKIINKGFSKNSNEVTQNLLFRDFTIDKNNQTGYGFNFANNITNIYIGRVEVKNVNSGFLVYWTDVNGMTVENSYFIDGGLNVAADNVAGTQRKGTYKRTIWRNNYFEKSANSAGGGLLTTGSTGNLLIEGNTFNNVAGTSYACISIENTFGVGEEIEVKNNIGFGCGMNVGNSVDPTKLINSAIYSGNKIIGFNNPQNSSGCINAYAQYVTLTDNQCTNTNLGINVGGMNGNVIATNNIIQNTNIHNSSTTFDKGGINVGNSSIITLSHNQIYSNSSNMPYGIRIADNPTSVISLDGNIIQGIYSEAPTQINDVGNLTLIGNHFYGGVTISSFTDLISSKNYGYADYFKNINQGFSSSKLQFYYTGKNETSILDYSGNGNNGTPTVNFVDGKFGSAYDFDGVDDKIISGLTSNSIFNNSDGFTISVWIKPNSVGEISGRIFDKTPAIDGKYGLNMYMSATNKLAIAINGSTPVLSATNSVIFGDNKWYHIVGTVNSTGFTSLYINGLVSGTPAQGGQPIAVNTTVPLTLGNRQGGTDRTFNGSIDEFMIFNKVLNSNEIIALYNSQSEINSKDSTQLKGTNYNPITNAVYNLGSSIFRWLKLWVQDIDASGTINATGNINTQSNFTVNNTNGVTGSGTSCVISEIKGGIITTAVCT